MNKNKIILVVVILAVANLLSLYNLATLKETEMLQDLYIKGIIDDIHEEFGVGPDNVYGYDRYSFSQIANNIKRDFRPQFFVENEEYKQFNELFGELLDEIKYYNFIKDYFKYIFGGIFIFTIISFLFMVKKKYIIIEK